MRKVEQQMLNAVRERREVEELRARNRQLLDDRDEIRREVEALRRDKATESIVEQMAEVVRERDELRREVEAHREMARTAMAVLRTAVYESRGVTADYSEIMALSEALNKIEDIARDSRTEPTWLPAPDAKPPDLADAQMVEVKLRDGLKSGEGVEAASQIPWQYAVEYRPLYSASGLPLCSPEGLDPGARYVWADELDTVWCGNFNPNDKEQCLDASFLKWSTTAPESHRKPGDWRDSLMEVMR